MGTLRILILSVLLCTCQDKGRPVLHEKKGPLNVSEQLLRQYFIDSFAFSEKDYYDTLTGFRSFYERYRPNLKAVNTFDPFIYALEEPYIDTTTIDTAILWFRIVIEPSFREPHCFVLDKTASRSFLTAKFTSGRGGYNTGTLLAVSRVPVIDTAARRIFNILDSLHFWQLKDDSTCQGGMDGQTWTFESIKGGKYNCVRRWSPRVCGDGTTRALSTLGHDMERLSAFKTILQTD